jgi:hypothetical protein
MSQEKDIEAQRRRAEALRAEIARLPRGPARGTPTEPAPDKQPESPHEFVQRRMREVARDQDK